MDFDITSYSKLPLTLTVDELSMLLRIGKNKAYQLTRRSDFPTLRIGCRILIPKDKLIEWLDQNNSKQ